MTREYKIIIGNYLINKFIKDGWRESKEIMRDDSLEPYWQELDTIIDGIIELRDLLNLKNLKGLDIPASDKVFGQLIIDNNIDRFLQLSYDAREHESVYHVTNDLMFDLIEINYVLHLGTSKHGRGE